MLIVKTTHRLTDNGGFKVENKIKEHDDDYVCEKQELGIIYRFVEKEEHFSLWIDWFYVRLLNKNCNKDDFYSFLRFTMNNGF